MSWNWDYAGEILPPLLAGLRTALLATVAGFLLALLLGAGFAALGSSRHRGVRVPAVLLVEVVRRTPLLVLLFLFYFGLPGLGLPGLGLPVDPLAAGILGLGLHYAAYTGDVWRSGSPRHGIPALCASLAALFSDIPQLVAIDVAEPLFVAREQMAQSYRIVEAITIAGLLYVLTALLLNWLRRVIERRYGPAPDDSGALDGHPDAEQDQHAAGDPVHHAAYRLGGEQPADAADREREQAPPHHRDAEEDRGQHG
jgi:polar amino acid transport system permease protein